MLDKVYILFHFNIILKHNGMFITKKNESDFVFFFSGVCVRVCAHAACLSVKGSFETELQEYN